MFRRDAYTTALLAHIGQRVVAPLGDAEVVGTLSDVGPGFIALADITIGDVEVAGITHIFAPAWVQVVADA